MSGTIVVIGSSNVDLIMKMSRLPQRGETITDAVFMQTFGGKGANQAVAAARAGGNVSFVNCVGDDRYGAAIIDNLKAAGIDVAFVFTLPGAASGTALVMIGEGGDNYLSVAPGANYCLARSHIDQIQPRIAQASLIMLQCEITLGAQGAWLADELAVTHVPAFAVPGVDATAAGDTFCGALAAALVDGQPLAQAATFANAAAAIAVTRLGAQPSIPTRREIEQFLATSESSR